VESKYKKLSRPINSRVLKNFMKRESDVKEAKVINLSFNCRDNLIGYFDYRGI